MKTHALIFALTAAFLLAVATPRDLDADIVLSLTPGGETHVNLGNTGVHIVSFYIAGTDGANHSLLASIPLFTLSGGVVQNPPGVISAPGGTGTSGYFAAGNLSVSELLNEPQGGASTSFLVNQEYTNPQSVPDTSNRELWFTLNLDTTGLADGNYTISLADANNSFFDAGGSPIAANNDLSFSVTAVPEPNSVALTLLLMGAGCVGRRQKRSQFQRI